MKSRDPGVPLAILALLGTALLGVGCSGQSETGDSASNSARVITPNESEKPDDAQRKAQKEVRFIEAVPAGPTKRDPILSRRERHRRQQRRDSKRTQKTDWWGNPFVRTARDAESTFAVDVDTGSYTAARENIRRSSMPPEDLVRVEEFVNYFDYSYPDPERGPFGVSYDGAPSPFRGSENVRSRDRYLLRVGVQGRRLKDLQRKPMHLTFLVDVSGSMRDSNRLPLAKKSLRILTRNLQPEDSVAIATYASGTRTMLEPTPATKSGDILTALSKLHAGGSTAMGSGLELAYRLADESFEKGAVNRVVVVSDGNANVGETSHDEILEAIAEKVDKGVTLSSVAFGGSHNDQMMEQLANEGNGNYSFVDEIGEARRIFGDELESTMQVIAKDVKIQVEFDEAAVEQYRLIGYENRSVDDEDFRDDTVDAGEIGAGHSVTAYYELLLSRDAPQRLGTVRIRHKKPTAHKSDPATERQFGLTRADLHSSFEGAPDDFRFGAAVALFADKLRGSPYASDVSWRWIRRTARDGVGQSRERKEFVELVEKVGTIDDTE